MIKVSMSDQRLRCDLSHLYFPFLVPLSDDPPLFSSTASSLPCVSLHECIGPGSAHQVLRGFIHCVEEATIASLMMKRGRILRHLQIAYSLNDHQQLGCDRHLSRFLGHVVPSPSFCFRQWVLLFDCEDSMEAFRVFDALALLVADPCFSLSRVREAYG